MVEGIYPKTLIMGENTLVGNESTITVKKHLFEPVPCSGLILRIIYGDRFNGTAKIWASSSHQNKDGDAVFIVAEYVLRMIKAGFHDANVFTNGVSKRHYKKYKFKLRILDSIDDIPNTLDRVIAYMGGDDEF